MIKGQLSNRLATSSIYFQSEDLLFPKKMFGMFKVDNLDYDVYALYQELFLRSSHSVGICIHKTNLKHVSKFSYLTSEDSAFIYENPHDIRIALNANLITYFVGVAYFVEEVNHVGAITFAECQLNLRMGAKNYGGRTWSNF